jgi:hypothetical protein
MMKKIFLFLTVFVLAGCGAAKTNAVPVSDSSDPLVLEAENINYYIPVFIKMSGEATPYPALSDSIQKLSDDINTVLNEKAVPAPDLPGRIDILGKSLINLQLSTGKVSEENAREIMGQMADLMALTQQLLNDTGRGLYMDLDKQEIIILPLDEIRAREKTYWGDDLDTSMPAIINTEPDPAYGDGTVETSTSTEAQ